MRGYLFFNIGNDLTDVTIGKNKLSILTSRKEFTTNIEIAEESISCLPLEEQYVPDKNQIDF